MTEDYAIGRSGISICADGICTMLLIVRCYVAAIGVVSVDGGWAEQTGYN